MSVATEAVFAAEQTGEYAPIRLNHLAYVTHDTAATVKFWTEVMQMPLVEAVMHWRESRRWALLIEGALGIIFGVVVLVNGLGSPAQPGNNVYVESGTDPDGIAWSAR